MSAVAVLPLTKPEPLIPARSFLGNCVELCKARLCALVVCTTAVGFVLASGASVDWPLLLVTSLGTALAALGANGANQCIEVERDARMLRTRLRPLPSGAMSQGAGWTVAVTCCVAGPLLLAIFVDGWTALMAVLCEALYVAAYTPMKPRSPLNTLIGAICGAIPPLMGWSAATGGALSSSAWVLGAILFVWQIPHFLALAWMYREDYARGGFRMLPSVDAGGKLTAEATLLYGMALTPIAMALTFLGATGRTYGVGVILLGAAFMLLCLKFYTRRDYPTAKRVFLASIVYLPVLLALMVADRRPQAADSLRAPAVVAAVGAGAR